MTAMLTLIVRNCCLWQSHTTSLCFTSSTAVSGCTRWRDQWEY